MKEQDGTRPDATPLSPPAERPYEASPDRREDAARARRFARRIDCAGPATPPDARAPHGRGTPRG